MPRLSCSVSNCNNNSHGCCALNNIDVSGGATKQNTCCSNFNNQSIASNCCSNVSPVTGIHCEAKDCINNQNCNCTANSVDICSCGSACNCKDTECGSFCRK